jgi:hypothetical protein
MCDTDWFLHIQKTENDCGNPISIDRAKRYRSELERLSAASRKKRDAARKKGKLKEAAAWNKKIWIRQDPASEYFGGGSTPWKNLGRDSRINPKSHRGKYHRMDGKTREDTLLFIIQTEGRTLGLDAERKGVTTEELAARRLKTLRANGILKFHERSGFWHGVDWNTASLENVERMSNELTEIQQRFRDKFGNLPKGYCDYSKPWQSSWLKSIAVLIGGTLDEAIKIDKALWACSKDRRKLPVRRIEKYWRCGFNWVDPAIAKAKADAEEKARLERERIENERIEAENAKAAKIQADKELAAKKENDRIEAEYAAAEKLSYQCRNMYSIKKDDYPAQFEWVERYVSKLHVGFILDVAFRAGHIQEGEVFVRGANMPEPLQKLTKSSGTRITFTQAHLDMADEEMERNVGLKNRPGRFLT